MTMEVLTVKEDHVTLDLLLWRRFIPTHDAGMPDVVYAAGAQQDLAEAGPILPVGTKVQVQIPDASSSPQPVQIIRLWS